MIYIVMGVSGSGKTSVGRLLAKRLDCSFHDADDFHPMDNVAKMASGIPLTDANRLPWLNRLADLVAALSKRGETSVLACSALKRAYRERLRVSDQVQYIYLYGDFDLIWQRMQQRTDHYMKAEMLRSQFAALEEPGDEEAWRFGIEPPVGGIVDLIVRQVRKSTDDRSHGPE